MVVVRTKAMDTSRCVLLFIRWIFLLPWVWALIPCFASPVVYIVSGKELDSQSGARKCFACVRAHSK